MLKEKKGITLIALIVTIIVLLILAGVTISAVVGENGIANKAKEAKVETDKGALKEEFERTLAEIQLESMTGNDPEVLLQEFIENMLVGMTRFEQISEEVTPDEFVMKSIDIDGIFQYENTYFTATVEWKVTGETAIENVEIIDELPEESLVIQPLIAGEFGPTMPDENGRVNVTYNGTLYTLEMNVTNENNLETVFIKVVQ